MMFMLAALAAAQTVQIPSQPSCSPSALRMIEGMDAIWKGFARRAGLSVEGERILIEARRDDATAIWCERGTSKMDATRDRLLSVLEAKQVDEAALALARNEQLEAVLQHEEAELDGLIRTMSSLSPGDRSKFAAMLREDLRRSQSRQEELGSAR